MVERLGTDGRVERSEGKRGRKGEIGFGVDRDEGTCLWASAREDMVGEGAEAKASKGSQLGKSAIHIVGDTN